MDIADLADRHIEDQVKYALASIRKENGVSRPKSTQNSVCAECGCDIPQARLAAVPGSVLCVTCADHHERQREGFYRPLGSRGPVYPSTTIYTIYPDRGGCYYSSPWR